MKILFNNKEEMLDCEIKFINNNVVELLNVEQNLSGFKIYNESDDELLGDYSNYTTLYKDSIEGYQLSNDGSIYIESEQIIPYEPTLSDIQKLKINELELTKNNLIENGQDIKLTNGIDHFNYKSNDQANIKNAYDIANALILKEVEMKIPFYDSNNICKKYSTKDIVTIYMSMQSYITYVITLSHQLEAMVKDSRDIEFINDLTFDIENLSGDYLNTFNEMIEQSQSIIKALGA